MYPLHCAASDLSPQSNSEFVWHYSCSFSASVVLLASDYCTESQATTQMLGKDEGTSRYLGCGHHQGKQLETADLGKQLEIRLRHQRVR